MVATCRFGTVLGLVTLCCICLLRTDTMAQQLNAAPATSDEMTHAGGGNRMAYRLEGGNRDRYLQRWQLPLVWGEDALLVPDVLRK